MRFLPSGKQMQYADRANIEKIGIPSIVLMERAALKVVEVIQREGVNCSSVLILCGSGNNGGDGFAVARLLKQQGHDVSVLFFGEEETASNGCLKQWDICRALDIPIIDYFLAKKKEQVDFSGFTLLIDAIFGVGLNRPLNQDYGVLFTEIEKSKGRKISIDLPTGICASSGKVLGSAFRADITVALQWEKRGTSLFPGNTYAGRVIPVEIGMVTDPDVLHNLGFGHAMDDTLCFAFEPSDVVEKIPKRTADSHKGSYGKVLIIAGSKGMSGAAFLCGSGAYAIGAGLVQIYTPWENREIIQTLLPEAIVVTYDKYNEQQLNRLLNWAEVVCLGCGFGQSETAEKILVHTLRNLSSPVVIDADGINLLKNHKELLKKLYNPCVMTPHIKEMATFLDREVLEIKENPIETVVDFVREYSTDPLRNSLCCVLKDARTLVGQYLSHTLINTSGNNAMAKGGSGDVLAGVITGLIAGGLSHYDAACLGVYLHGLGGDKGKEKLGEYSVLARDIVKGIERVLSEG